MAATTATKARNGFSKLLKRVFDKGEPVAISRRGKLVAGLVPPEDFEYIQRLRAKEDAEDLKAAKAALARYRKTGKAIPWEQIQKENGLP